jgi:ABC-type nitrate/sulfonate/bicarbonate transport system substrate-binding protein
MRCFFLSFSFSVFAAPAKDTGTSAGVPLKVGIMPDADSLPFMVARDEGLFAKEGVKHAAC